MFTRQFLTQAPLGLGLAIALISPAFSQITPNGAGTVVNSQGNQINITGGTQAGANLFHSFRDFNVNSAQVANFLSNPQIQNILARINGGNPSMINGLLQITGGNSNLFLMNPAGIVFGQGASLNIPASFTATTANQIGFGNNLFNAFGDNNFSALVGNPDSFIFNTSQAGSIVNAGNLAVGSGQNISLIGGNTINTGRLTAPGGEIQVLAVPGTNRVRLSQPGQVLSLEIVPPVDGVLRAVDLPALLTGRDLPGIQVNSAGQVQVAGTTLPNQQGIAVASGRIDVSSATGNGGVVQVMGDRVAALDARINANGATGGGTVRLGGEYLGGRDTGIAPALRFNSQRTLVDRNSLIRANATVSGEGGRVIVWADQNTGYFGRITGRGATGRGAFVEISGRENLAFDGRVEIPGANGLFGSLLLDPLNVVIGAATTDDTQIADGIIGAGESPGATWFISAGALAAIPAATAIDIAATNNIDFQTPVVLTPGTGAVSFTAPTITASAGAVDLSTRGRNLTLTADSIDAANLSISTSDIGVRSGTIQASANNGNLRLGNLITANNGVNGGAITLNVPLGAITTGNIIDSGTNNGNGGAINFTSQGNISALNITSYVVAGTGNGGAISLTSQGNISTGEIYTYTVNGNAGAISLTSQGNISTGIILGVGTGGNGGAINFTSSLGNITTETISSTGTGNGGVINLTSQGNILTGYINTSVATALGNGGNVTLNATTGDISTGYIDTGTNAAVGNSGNGGNVTLNAQNVLINGLISSSSGANSGTSGNGGNIILNAQNNLTTGVINSSSASSSGGNSGNGGNITLNAQNNLTTGGIDSGSVSGGGTSGNSGNITLIAQNNLTTDFINSISITGAGDSGNGGNVTLSAQNNLTTSYIYSYSNSLGINSGNGGNVILNATSGSIRLSNIDSSSYVGSNGTGGRVDISTGNLFLATGSNGVGSITTQGGAGGGAITITHGGGTSTPFLVGNATNNGTFAAITSGTGANTINNLTVPVPPTTNPYGSNINIITTVPLAIPPEVLELLRNPAPPPTPAAVVVGVPEPETPPFVAPPKIEPPIVEPPIVEPPKIEPPIIAPPQPPQPPESPVSPEITLPSQTLCDVSRCTLPPNVPIINTLAPSINSPLRIITKISGAAIENNSLLLEQLFEEEFRTFAGIAEPVPILDIKQSQEILDRISKETTAKPVLVYVFFAPPNDVTPGTRNANSARGQLNRTPSSTDILEIVLVPPKGEITRVRYPGLRRSEITETAQIFSKLVAQANFTYVGSSKRMYELIVAPLEEALKEQEINNLVFLMDEGLRSMPLAAMQNRDNKFIIEDYSIGLMPSLTMTNTTYRSIQDAQVLAMGAENFISKDLNALPAVPLELNAINQLQGGNIFLNEKFTLSNLRQPRRPEQRIVHLATHASFVSGSPANSYIQLWENERLTLDQIRQANLTTPLVDLLVLSACQTAIGDRDAELGFAGLSITSGVRSALASLWQVNDGGTMGLMTAFYQQLPKTTTKAEALRQAQLLMLRGEVRLEGGSLVTPQGRFPLPDNLKRLENKQLTHPYFWSAFTMIGNPW